MDKGLLNLVDALVEFEDIYLTPHQVMAARPTALFAPLLRRARLKVCAEWAGWALVLRDHNTLTIPLHPAATMPLLLAG